MKPYLLATGDFVKTGGMDRANHALASYLAKQGREVHLVAFRADEDLLEKPTVILHRVPKIADSQMLSAFLLDRLGRRRAAEIANRGGRVIVNGGNCRWDDVNWVHHLHAADSPQPVGNLPRRIKIRLSYRLNRRDERLIVPMARLIMTTCERNKRDIQARLQIPPARVRVVPYGIDPQLFRRPSSEERRLARLELGLPADKPLIAFIGEFGDGRKGFGTLFAAWRMLCANGPWDVDLAVAGTGAGLGSWQSLASKTGLKSRVHFMGFLKDCHRLFWACDAHALPSRYEGYSLVTQEALCCGLPAFITATAGIAERYPAELSELLIPDPENPSDLARRLRDWRERMQNFQKMVAPFANELRAFTWSHMARQMMEIIDGAD